MRHIRGRVPLAAVLAVCLIGPAPAAADPNALWTIVHDQCVVDEQQHHNPAPCSRVDLRGGEQGGYAVLKDLVGERQYLLIPTARISGIESPELLDPGTPNYFAAAWPARSFVEQRAGGTIARDWTSLAINSEVARTQDQLHIHIDCVRSDVHDALRAAAGGIGPVWSPLAVPLVGHSYWAMSVPGADLDANPFTLLADGLPGARAAMGLHTLVVVGATDAAGRPGFVILADRSDSGTPAGGEELQDHNACPPPMSATPTTAK
ncbi:CDP-diacylglycerol diphosphatase [Mycobacterium sp. CVI_P3]|uniref:CDP-diacylglycerol diphosphatase n=1 Tax=Mycobacterium pinniadriaticum TaxID=2994102 RepID=A0ABT3S9A6_9MYCO|nr:CDP-diacylglycerol diphosphatase [Mycobacterium pinniadriaticum]MCX2929528.1 CDP-diacylglycerol diphosphatase [Mycobacterium pinniadriaticum]MCX2935952.1 CDP-diacylglycerol diphosphatase [Mycobacterium pinniadriaticum]